MGRSVVALSRRTDDSCNTGPDPPYLIGTIARHQCPAEDHLLVVIFTVHIHSVVLTPRITSECTHDAQVILEMAAHANLSADFQLAGKRSCICIIGSKAGNLRPLLNGEILKNSPNGDFPYFPKHASSI